MAAAWGTFREAGFVAWIILLVGLIALAASAATLLMVAARARVAPWLAMATMVLGAMAAGLGGAGVLYGRSVVDRVLGGGVVSPVQAERIRRQGYLEARSAAKVGLFFAHLPIAVGLTMFLRRRKSDGAPLPGAPAPALEGPGLGLPIGVTAGAVMAYTLALVGLRAPLPGRDIPVDDPLWRVLEEIDAVLHIEDRPGNDLGLACSRLESALPLDPAQPSPSLMPDFPAAARKCLDDRRKRAAELVGAQRVQRELEAIVRSGLAQRDPESRRRAEADLAEIRSAPADGAR